MSQITNLSLSDRLLESRLQSGWSDLLKTVGAGALALNTLFCGGSDSLPTTPPPPPHLQNLLLMQLQTVKLLATLLLKDIADLSYLEVIMG